MTIKLGRELAPDKTNGSIELRRQIREQLEAEEERAKREAEEDAQLFSHANMGREALKAHLEAIGAGKKR